MQLDDMETPVKYVERKLDIAGTAIEMHLCYFSHSIKGRFQIAVAHFDQNRTIEYKL